MRCALLASDASACGFSPPVFQLWGEDRDIADPAVLKACCAVAGARPQATLAAAMAGGAWLYAPTPTKSSLLFGGADLLCRQNRICHFSQDRIARARSNVARLRA
jgi:hypothetical protein